MIATSIDIFRPGRHVAMAGEELDFSPADLAATAAVYDPFTHEAPIVMGHPAHDLPAYGWVKRLAFQDGHLLAELDRVDPEFRELVQAGRYKKISASFYRPDAPANPKPGSWYLRHVGFLGAQAPAVKGLKPVQFAAGDGSVEFSAPSEMAIIEAARDSRDRAIADLTGRSAVAYIGLARHRGEHGRRRAPHLCLPGRSRSSLRRPGAKRVLRRGRSPRGEGDAGQQLDPSHSSRSRAARPDGDYGALGGRPSGRPRGRGPGRGRAARAGAPRPGSRRWGCTSGRPRRFARSSTAPRWRSRWAGAPRSSALAPRWPQRSPACTPAGSPSMGCARGLAIWA